MKRREGILFRAGILLVFLTAIASWSDEPSENYGSGGSGFLNIYQEIISPARGLHCPMHPSCSQYAKMAFSKAGPFDAFFLTTDRLMRCGQDLGTYSVRYIAGNPKAYDPLPMEISTGGGGGSGADSIPTMGRDSSSLADWLLDLGQSDLAFLEFAREHHAATSDSLRGITALKMAGCLRTMGDFRGLARLYRVLAAQRPRLLKKTVADLRVQESLALFEAKEYEKSLATLRLADIDTNSDGFETNRILQCMNLARLEKWDPLVSMASSLQSRSGLGEISMEFRNLPGIAIKSGAKSPALAGWMSAVVPGSGFAYAGKPGAGIAAFVINGLFFWTIMESVRNENYAIAATATALGMGWYIGGIKGSRSSVLELNHRKRQRRVDAAIQAANKVLIEKGKL